LVGLALATACLAGCDAFSGTSQEDAASLTPADLSRSAREAYFEGMKDLVAANYTQATQRFEQVARGPRYVHYAALARLRAGDAAFYQESYEEAIRHYRAFATQYESDPNLPYARFRVAAAYHARIPSEWFLSVPSYEIDQTMGKEALRELKDFLATFPISRFMEDARAMKAEVEQLLFDHEIYVADFYEADDKWRAVAWRLDTAIQSYPSLALNPGLVWRLVRAFGAVEDRDGEMRSLALYLDKFPEGPHMDEARSRLDTLQTGPVSPDVDGS
jgi:outer membrane protein assembly factor BamD